MSIQSDFNVSVVIPLYNHANYIEEAIDSVFAQTLSVAEIIIVDDGSKDESYSKAKKYLAKKQKGLVITQQNAGAHAALNRGIKLSKSEFIAVLNSDDKFKPNKIERCAQVLAANSRIDMIFGNVALIDQHSSAVTDGPTVDWLRRCRAFLEISRELDLSLFNENFAVTTSNMFFSRQLWRKNKGFQALRYCHDLDFVFETFKKGNIFFDSEVEHVDYRVHPNNTIKENLSSIRAEIACVLTEGLISGIPGKEIKQIDARWLDLFDKSLRGKDLSHLLVFLMSKRSQLKDRQSFYDWAMNNSDNNRLLKSYIDGNLNTDTETRTGEYLPAKSIYAASANEDHTSAPKIGTVLVELSRFDRGGLEKVVLDTSLVLKKKGIEVVIVSCGPVGHLGEIAVAGGIQVYQLPDQDIEGFYCGLLTKHNITVAMSHFSRVGYPFFSKLNIPNVTFIHNVYAMLGGAALDYFIADDPFVHTYISVSPKATEYAVARLKVSPQKIITIPNGLIIEEHNAKYLTADPISRGELGIKEDDYVFLNVASYNLHKNHYLMAAAMRLILAKTRKIKIVCIGNTIIPHHFKEFMKHLSSNELSSNIILPGYFEDVAPFYKMADAFLLPSLIEGWSIAMNEAMYFEKPLLMTDTGGASEVIEDSDIGILIPNEYGEAKNLDSVLLDEIGYNRRHFKTAAYLAKGMIDFAQNAEYWRVAGKNGRIKILQKYDFSTMVDKYITHLEAIVSSQPVGRR